MTDILSHQQLEFIDSGHASSVTSPGSSVPVNGENNLVNNHSLNNDFTALQLEQHHSIVPSKTQFLQRPGGPLLNERNRLTKRRNDEAFDHSELPSGSEDITSTAESEDSDYGGGFGEVDETCASELENGWWQPTERTRLVRRIRYERRIPRAVEMHELTSCLPLSQRQICRNNRAFDEMIEIDNDSLSAEDEPLSSEDELGISGSLHAKLYGQSSSFGTRLNEGGPGFNSRQHLDYSEEKLEEEERPFYTKHHVSANGCRREGLGFNSAITSSSRSNGCPDVYSDMCSLYRRETFETESPWVRQQQQASETKRVDDRVVYNYLENPSFYKGVTGLLNDSKNYRINPTSVTKPMPLGLAINKCKNMALEAEKMKEGYLLQDDILKKINNKDKKNHVCVGANDESISISEGLALVDNAVQQQLQPTNDRSKTSSYANNEGSAVASNEISRVETMRRRKQQKQNKKNEIVVQVADVPGYRGDQSIDVVLNYINSSCGVASVSQTPSSRRASASTPAVSSSAAAATNSSVSTPENVTSSKKTRKQNNKRVAPKVEAPTSSKTSPPVVSTSDTSPANDKELHVVPTDVLSTAVVQNNGAEKAHSKSTKKSAPSKKDSLSRGKDVLKSDMQNDAIQSKSASSGVNGDSQQQQLVSLVDETKASYSVDMTTPLLSVEQPAEQPDEQPVEKPVEQQSAIIGTSLTASASAPIDTALNEDKIIIITDFDKLCSEFDPVAEREVGFQEVVRKKATSRRNKQPASASTIAHAAACAPATVALNNQQQDYQRGYQRIQHSTASFRTLHVAISIAEHAPHQQHSTSNSVTRPSPHQRKEEKDAQPILYPSPFLRGGENSVVLDKQLITLFEYMDQLKWLQTQYAEDFPIEFDQNARRAFLFLQKRLRDDFAALECTVRRKIEAT